jgi:hypothetical protein
MASYISLGSVLLVSVIIWTHSSGMQTLKSSALATMFALDNGVRYATPPTNDLSELEQSARKTIVRLETGQFGKGVRLTSAK